MSNTPEPQHLALPTKVAQQIMDYLASRPYAEVFGLIADLQKAQPVLFQEPAPEP